MNIPKEFFFALGGSPLSSDYGRADASGGKNLNFGNSDLSIAPAVSLKSDAPKVIFAKENLAKNHVAARNENEEVSVDREVFMPQDESFFVENVGQLVVDVYQTQDEIVIQSTIAGVDSDNLDISVSADTATIKGKRAKEKEAADQDYFCQECYWGSFARTIILPAEVEPEKTKASLKNGILTIRLPKAKKNLVKKIKISSE